MQFKIYIYIYVYTLLHILLHIYISIYTYTFLISTDTDDLLSNASSKTNAHKQSLELKSLEEEIANELNIYNYIF